jgi:hypothetical protein
MFDSAQQAKCLSCRARKVVQNSAWGASGRCRADKLISARREARPDGENIAALQPAAERGGRCEWPTIKGGQAE